MKNWKNWVIFKPLKDIYDSLFNNDNGFSFRKAAACFSICGVGAEVTYSISDDQFKLYALYAWLTFASVCIGLVTIPDLIKFLNKPNEAVK